MCFPQKIPRPWRFVTRVIAMSTGGFSTATHRDDLHKLAQQAKSFLQCPPLFGSQHCVKLTSRCGDTFDESAWVWFHQRRRRPFIFSKHLSDIFIKVILSKKIVMAEIIMFFPEPEILQVNYCFTLFCLEAGHLWCFEWTIPIRNWLVCFWSTGEREGGYIHSPLWRMQLQRGPKEHQLVILVPVE